MAEPESTHTATCAAHHTWSVVLAENPPRRDARCPKCERLAIKYVKR